jgi:hypothetical protein
VRQPVKLICHARRGGHQRLSGVVIKSSNYSGKINAEEKFSLTQIM